jgi:hypothetical protein
MCKVMSRRHVHQPSDIVSFALMTVSARQTQHDNLSTTISARSQYVE